MKKLLLMLFSASIFAAEYFISPDGSDANEGTRESPWQSIAKLSSSLKIGDTGIFLPGTYEGVIEPKLSGSRETQIVYKSDVPYKAVLKGRNSGEYAVYIKNVDHITIDGFTFEAKSKTRWFYLENANFCRIRNCNLDHVDIAVPAKTMNCHYCHFENLKLLRCDNRGANGVLSGDMWNNYAATHCVFEKIYVSRAGHRPFGLWQDCSDIVVRDCIFDGRWCRDFEFFIPRRVLMERCIITNAYEGSGSADGRAKLFVLDSIFRNNLIFRNGFLPVAATSYRYNELAPFGISRSMLYSNTWCMNQGCGWEMYGMQGHDLVCGNVFKNNIMVDNNPADGTAIMFNYCIAKDNLFISNLLRGRKDGEKTIKKYEFQKGFLCYTAQEANETFPDMFKNNFDADPMFVDISVDNFRLRPESQAIDKAEPLTRVRENAKNLYYISVDDARYFYDGYGIPWEKGDVVYIGAEKKSARILRVDVEHNMLKLDKRIDCSKGDIVCLKYAGEAPDLGAYEYGLEDGTETGPVFDYKVCREEKMDTADECVINCTFEEEELEKWFHLWKFTRRINSFGAIDNTTCASGKSSLRVYYEKNSHGKNVEGSVLETVINPAQWDIDRFPIVRFSYRIPKDVPVGISLHSEQSTGGSNDSANVYIGGSPRLITENKWSKLPNLKKIQLIDDDKWHTIEFDARAIREVSPKAKILSRLKFATLGINGKPGDQYWLDDFSINPATND